MLVKEMHIQFSLGLQKLGANSRRKFFGEEVDTLLNRAMNQFVLDQVQVKEDESGFQSTQVNVDKIRPLIRAVEPIAAKITSLGRVAYEVLLPSDYAHLISDSWYSAKNCSTVTQAQEPEYIAILPFPKTTKVAAPFYSTLKITHNSVEVLNVQSQNSLFTGYQSVEDRFSAVKLMQDMYNAKLRNGDTGVTRGLYWEYYKDKHYPNSFILVSSTAAAASITIDAVTTAGTIYDRSFDKQTPSTWTVVTGRLVKSSVLSQILNTPFYNPSPRSPISVLSGTTLTVYPHKSYIVNKASLAYVRTASRIDLSLHHNCEIAPEFHQTIVDMAVEYAAGRLEQQTLYQVQATENLKNK